MQPSGPTPQRADHDLALQQQLEHPVIDLALRPMRRSLSHAHRAMLLDGYRSDDLIGETGRWEDLLGRVENQLF